MHREIGSMSEPCEPSDSSAKTKKQGRGATRLPGLTLNRAAEQRIPIEIDDSTGFPKGPNTIKFRSYVALLGRSKASIQEKDWNAVEMMVKDQIWQSIMVF